MNCRKGFLGLAVLATLAMATPAQANLNTDLASAAAGGDYSSVMTALQLGANPNARDRVGRTPLAWAARNGKLGVSAYLLAHGAVLNAVDNEGYTPLMWAAKGAHFDVVALLVNAGANPLLRTWQGYDALTLARVAHDWRSEDMLYRYIHGETIGNTPRPHRVAPTQSGAVTPTVAAVPSLPPIAAAMAAPVNGPTEPGPVAKAVALKKLSDAAVRASGTFDDFMKANTNNPMAIADPDVPFSKQLADMYTNVAKNQSLLTCRQDYIKLQGALNGRTNSRFNQNMMDVDVILKEAGV